MTDATQADVVLISQPPNRAWSFDLHGIFHSFDDALAHVRKDIGRDDIEWGKITADACEFIEPRLLVHNARWVAARTPIRAKEAVA